MVLSFQEGEGGFGAVDWIVGHGKNLVKP